MLAVFPSARVRALVRVCNSARWADQWSGSQPCSTTGVTVVTAYPVQYPPSCSLRLPSEKSSRLTLGMAVSVRPGQKEKTRLESLRRSGEVLPPVLANVWLALSPHCFDSHPGVLPIKPDI
jgi:hypothetical protein